MSTDFSRLLFGLLFTVLCLPVMATNGSEITASFSTSNVKPWGYKDAQGNCAGLLSELVDKLRVQTGFKITNHIRPYPRVILEISRGDVDFAVMFNSPQAKEIGISVGRVVKANILLIGRAGAPRLQTLDELKGKTIGHIRGSKYSKEFDDLTGVEKISLESMEQGVTMLLRDRIYVMAGADQTIYYALEKLKIPVHEITSVYTISTASADLYFSRESTRTELIEPMRKAMAELQTQGILERIFYSENH